jgi:transcriptional regulator with XRE-family HTH domain
MSLKKRRAAEHVQVVLRKYLGDGAVGIRARELAARVGVTRSTIYHWRAGTRGLGAEEIVALAREFRMTTDQLLGIEPAPPPKVDPKLIAERLRAIAGAAVKAADAIRHAVDELADQVDPPAPGARGRRRRAT